MSEDKLQTWLLKYGSNPQKSAKWFGLGLFLFFAGMIGLYLTPQGPLWLSGFSLLVLIVGVITTLKGYVGILFNRLAYFRHNAAKNRQKYKHLE